LLFTFVEVADGTVEPCKSGLRLFFLMNGWSHGCGSKWKT
jgi:hypothetical protein